MAVWLSNVVEWSVIPPSENTTDSKNPFCETKKAKMVYEMGYTVFDKSIFDTFLIWLNDYRVSLRDIESLPYDISTLRPKRMYNDPITGGLRVILPKPLEVSEENGLVTESYVQNSLSMFRVQVLECIPEQYEWVVPDHVINSYDAHAENFDEVVVLYPKVKEVSPILYPASQPVDDPILAGKLISCPGKYFLIDYRKEDVNLVAAIWWKDMSKVLIQESMVPMSNNPKRISIF